MKDMPSLSAVRRMKPGPEREILEGLHQLKTDIAGRFENPLVVGTWHNSDDWGIGSMSVGGLFVAEMVPKRILGFIAWRKKRFLVDISEPTLMPSSWSIG